MKKEALNRAKEITSMLDRLNCVIKGIESINTNISLKS